MSFGSLFKVKAILHSSSETASLVHEVWGAWGSCLLQGIDFKDMHRDGSGGR